jgi:hypothetical protein
MNSLKEGAVWRNCPMREVIEIRNLKECDCATVAERRRVLPPLPSSPLRVLLGYAVITWSRNSKEGVRDLSDVTRNSTRCCVLRVLDSSVDRRDWRQCRASMTSQYELLVRTSKVRVEECRTIVSTSRPV